VGTQRRLLISCLLFKQFAVDDEIAEADGRPEFDLNGSIFRHRFTDFRILAKSEKRIAKSAPVSPCGETVLAS
jgi:hypothetical protein